VPPVPSTTTHPPPADNKSASVTCQIPKTDEKYSYWMEKQCSTIQPLAHSPPLENAMIESQPFPPKLTARQQQILELIQSAIARTGAPPTRAEIANELGFKSANAAEEHLQALARKGVIELVSGTSRGIRLRSEDLQSINASRGRQLTLPLPSLTQLMLPLIGRVAAGSPILAQEHVDQTYQVERSLFQRTPDYLLRVRGMSMRDIGIMDGDLLAVQASKEAKNGQIVVARLGDDVTVKRFMRRQNSIELHAENPDYKTIVVEPGEPFEIEGLAVGLIRNSFQL
jgi:repressor LexA